ncbi:hypothetical protein ABIB73_005629 [Bradyrhizobium sp. F1.4.3]|uniref:hypothetical protein n=1 Tax=Bradyrhizobium sp. F1.4.3 TaxID=3156356 RepID=UPI00339A1129
MSFKKWVMQRRALKLVSGPGADAAGEESYRETGLSVAKFLHVQRALTGDVRLIRKTGEANVKALGYIYGFTDAAFQSAGMDIGSEYGVSALVALISEFDRPNAEILWLRLKCPGDAWALMDGVRIGFEDYDRLMRGERTRDELAFGWAKCFPNA